MLRKWVFAAVCGVLLAGTPAALAASPTGEELAQAKLGARHSGGGLGRGRGRGSEDQELQGARAQRPRPERDERRRVRARELRLRRHVGDPCNGRGVKIVDVSESARSAADRQRSRRGRGRAPRTWLSGGSRRRSSAAISWASGSSAAARTRRSTRRSSGSSSGTSPNPYAPVYLAEFARRPRQRRRARARPLPARRPGLRTARPSVQRVVRPAGHGDFMIVDVTNPSLPVMTADWGAGMNGLLARARSGARASFGAMFGHSARASADGTKAYVSYWDLGVLTFDISDVDEPGARRTRTMYEPWEDGDAHSMTPYRRARPRVHPPERRGLRPEDTRRDPLHRHGAGIGIERPGETSDLARARAQDLRRCREAANQGCGAATTRRDGRARSRSSTRRSRSSTRAAGTSRSAPQQEQEAAAEAAGAVAVVHDFVAENTSPQWFDFGEVDISVLFTDHETAHGMVEAGKARSRPGSRRGATCGCTTRRRASRWRSSTRPPNVRSLPAPPGEWTIHNTEIDAATARTARGTRTGSSRSTSATFEKRKTARPEDGRASSFRRRPSQLFPIRGRLGRGDQARTGSSSPATWAAVSGS